MSSSADAEPGPSSKSPIHTVSSDISPDYGTMRSSEKSYPEDFEDAYEREKWTRLIVAFLLLASTAILNPLAVSVLNDIAPRTPLPDTIFRLIPQYHWARTAGDALVAIAAIFILLYGILHRFRVIVYRRIFLIGAILYLFRICALAATQLPVGFQNASAECLPVVKNPTAKIIWQRFVWKFFQMGTSPANGLDLCGDMFYSGHTTVFTSCMMLVMWYTPRSLRFLRWIVIPACVAGMFCLIFSRLHYSLDVLVGYWLSMGMYTLYHGFCELPHDMRRRSVLRTLIVTRLFLWMEETVPAGKMPNRLNWPLPFFVSFDSILRKLSDPVPLPTQSDSDQEDTDNNEMTNPLLSEVVIVRNKSR